MVGEWSERRGASCLATYSARAAQKPIEPLPHITHTRNVSGINTWMARLTSSRARRAARTSGCSSPPDMERVTKSAGLAYSSY